MSNSMNIDDRLSLFSKCVHKYFDFLESDYGMEIKKARIFDEKYLQDAYFRIRCQSESDRIDIAWGVVDGLQICIRNKKLADKKVNYLYFEPFIEFITNGKEKPIVPFISGGEKYSKMDKLFDEYCALMANEQTIENVFRKLADKLKKYYEIILQCDESKYYEFHEYLRIRK